MTTIYKYPIPVADRPLIDMPRGARLLHVAEQNGGLFVWAVVDTSAPMVSRSLRVAGTGHRLDLVEARSPHVGTMILSGGMLVFHVFDLGEV